MSYRVETDSMGDIEVPADRYDGAQTNINVNEVISNRTIELAGGTAVGTGLNSHLQFAVKVAAKIAKKAYQENFTLREAAIALGILSGEKFDDLVRPEKTIGPEW